MKHTVRIFGAAALLLAAGTLQAQSAPAYSYYDDSPPTSPASYSDALARGGTESTELAIDKGAACGCRAGCADCCNDCFDCCCGPNWIARAGAVILTRDEPSFTPSPGQTVSDIEDFDWVGGPDIYVAGRIGSSDDWIEVRYFDVQNWNADYVFTDPATSDGAFSSRLYSTEINFRRQYSPRIAALVGFRWVELHEQFRNTAVGVPFSFATSTGNHLYGAQIGLDGMLWSRGGPFRVEGWAKAGIYGTASRGHFTNTIGFDQTVDADEVSFIGDLAINGVYQLNDTIGLRVGYQLLWIEGVAEAGDQLQFSTSPPPLTELDTSGGIFAHGVLLGVDFAW